MERIPEPELMDDPAQAEAYAVADFADVNQGFVERVRAGLPPDVHGRAIDLGCGPADIPSRLAEALPALEIVAVDGARAMLRLAQRALRSRSQRAVRLVAARLPALPFPDRSFDLCVSNSLLHHLAAPDRFWQELRRIGRPGAWLFVMDLFRPPNRSAARTIVEQAAANESPILRRDFYHSLLAAYTVAEIRTQLARNELGQCSCEIVSERHWLVVGRLAE